MTVHIPGADDAAPIDRWLLEAGLDGIPIEKILDGFCRRLAAAGMPVERAYVSTSTLHPLIRAHGYLWRSGEGSIESASFLVEDMESQAFVDSPFKMMLDSQQLFVRRRLSGPEACPDFPVLREFAAEGYTDWLAMVHNFGWELTTSATFASYPRIGMISSWATTAPEGFTDGMLATLQHLVPALALAVKAATNVQIAQNILGTYVGADVASHVLSGEIRRGMARKIEAVILCADLRGFTGLADRLPVEPLVETLNAYFDCLGPPIAAQGGEVLKFLGDGLLASFQLVSGADPAPVGAAALAAAEQALAAVAILNAERRAAGLPVMELDVALHCGTVMYGNVGTGARLDFTLIGPAINEAARLESLCATLGRNLLASETFAAIAGAVAGRLESLGRHPLRGVTRPRDVFGLREPAA